MTNAVVVLITRYNEYIDWVRYIVDKVDKIIVFNKGFNDLLFKHYIPDLTKIEVRQSENVGRIDHTIASYISDNWDSLPDTLVSLPGSVMMCEKKGYYLQAMMKRIDKMGNYAGYYSPRFHHVSPNFNYTIDNYQAEGICNRNDNPFVKSEYPDFKAWKNAIIDTVPMKYVGMRGMFVVSRENIKFVNKEIYQRLVVSLSVGDNIENGHFAERIWAHLFKQITLPGPGLVPGDVTILIKPEN